MDGTHRDLAASARRRALQAPLWARPLLRRLGGLWRLGRLMLVLANGAVWRIDSSQTLRGSAFGAAVGIARLPA